MRLSVYYRRPIDEVLAWPAAHIRLIAQFIAREPMIEARVERILASMAADAYNRDRKKTDWRKPSDYLLALDAWPEVVDTPAGRYSEADRKTLATLMGLRKKR